jgi:hypothetical protein
VEKGECDARHRPSPICVGARKIVGNIDGRAAGVRKGESNNMHRPFPICVNQYKGGRGDAWHLPRPFPPPSPHYRHCSLSCDLHGNRQDAFPTSSTKPTWILRLQEVLTMWCAMVGKGMSDDRHHPSPTLCWVREFDVEHRLSPLVLVKTNANGGMAMSNITFSLTHPFSFETFK